MAEELGALVVRIGSDSSTLQSDLQRAKNSISNFATSARDAIPSVAAMGAAAAAAAAVGVAALISKTMDAVGAQADLAARLGTTSASIANLSHAAMLSGVEMGKVEASTEFLNRQLSKASESGSAAADTFARLKLKAGDLQAMPLDERIATINQALIDNVAASDRAAVAAEVYGSKAGSAMRALSPGAIAEAAAQVEKLGLNISEIDAEKIAAAGDAVDAASKVFDGMMQQMTAELAPTITAIANQFMGAATSVEGFGNAGKSAVSGLTTSIGFVADAFEGVNRTADAAYNTLMAMGNQLDVEFNTFAQMVLAGPVAAINLLLDGLDMIPGIDIGRVDISGLQRNIDGYHNEINARMDALRERMMEPMPSDQFKQYVAEAKAAAEQTAAVQVEMRKAMQGEGDGQDSGNPKNNEKADKASKKSSEDLKTRLEAVREANASELQLLSEKHGKEDETIKAALAARQITYEQFSAMKAATDARHAEETMALLSKEDPQTAALAARIEALRASNETEIAMAADKQAQINAIMQSGGQEESADPGSLGNVEARLARIAQANATELEMLRTKHAEEMALIAEADAAKFESEEARRALELETAARHADEMAAVKKKEEDAKTRLQKEAEANRRAAMGDALSNLTTLMNTNSRKMFEVGKAAAIAQTVISTYEGAQKTYTALAYNPPLAIAAAGAAIAAGVARVQSIRSQQFGAGASTPTGSNTGQINAGGQPVSAAGGGGGSSGSGQTMFIQGINKNDLYTGSQLIDVINEAQRNGSKLVML